MPRAAWLARFLRVCQIIAAQHFNVTPAFLNFICSEKSRYCSMSSSSQASHWHIQIFHAWVWGRLISKHIFMESSNFCHYTLFVLGLGRWIFVQAFNRVLQAVFFSQLFQKYRPGSTVVAGVTNQVFYYLIDFRFGVCPNAVEKRKYISMKFSFNWEVTAEEVECRVGSILTQFQDWPQGFSLEYREGF